MDCILVFLRLKDVTFSNAVVFIATDTDPQVFSF